MFGPEKTPHSNSRMEQIRSSIEELRKVKVINQSDPKYAEEIQEQIDALTEELQSITGYRQ